MACERCGTPTTGRFCRFCEREQRHGDDLDEHDWAECPQCGGITSGAGIVCATCRRKDGETV